MVQRKQITARAKARTVLAALYLAAGILHLGLPVVFVAITPPWVPFPEQVVALTGLARWRAHSA